MDRNSAYYELLERYRPMVWRLCWRHARGDWDRCNDLVQEVSIALWEHFGQLRPNATTQEQRAWVRWQARSVLDLQRRKHTSSPSRSPTPWPRPWSTNQRATRRRWPR